VRLVRSKDREDIKKMKMQTRTWFVAMLAGIALAGCGGKKVETVPEPAPPPPPPPPPAPVVETPPPVVEEVVVLNLDKVHFEFDKYELTPEARTALASNAAQLLEHAAFSVHIAGHCDERGTVEYNLALGEKRAEAARDFLVEYGVAASRITTVSFGKNRPLVKGVDEETWAMNRRDEFNASK
jgi:peptidoglycan-associated lipoprotein